MNRECLTIRRTLVMLAAMAALLAGPPPAPAQRKEPLPTHKFTNCKGRTSASYFFTKS